VVLWLTQEDFTRSNELRFSSQDYRVGYEYNNSRVGYVKLAKVLFLEKMPGFDFEVLIGAPPNPEWWNEVGELYLCYVDKNLFNSFEDEKPVIGYDSYLLFKRSDDKKSPISLLDYLLSASQRGMNSTHYSRVNPQRAYNLISLLKGQDSIQAFSEENINSIKRVLESCEKDVLFYTLVDERCCAFIFNHPGTLTLDEWDAEVLGCASLEGTFLQFPQVLPVEEEIVRKIKLPTLGETREKRISETKKYYIFLEQVCNPSRKEFS